MYHSTLPVTTMALHAFRFMRAAAFYTGLCHENSNAKR